MQQIWVFNEIWVWFFALYTQPLNWMGNKTFSSSHRMSRVPSPKICQGRFNYAKRELKVWAKTLKCNSLLIPKSEMNFGSRQNFSRNLSNLTQSIFQLLRLTKLFEDIFLKLHLCIFLTSVWHFSSKKWVNFLWIFSIFRFGSLLLTSNESVVLSNKNKQSPEDLSPIFRDM